MNSQDKTTFTKIAVLDNVIEAQLVESVLKEERIPHQIRSYHDTAYDGLFQFQKGYGEVLSPLKFKQRIIDIISDIKNGKNLTSHR